jgi:hypothetical protein
MAQAAALVEVLEVHVVLIGHGFSKMAASRLAAQFVALRASLGEEAAVGRSNSAAFAASSS